eukprot:GHVP01047632.1.p1 GENE.GHVP01047632.1~~GHVP01047632.1.p1  ORF type:complete len:577 (+),score=66.37 GHVP01047632.1:417-2147(+)
MNSEQNQSIRNSPGNSQNNTPQNSPNNNNSSNKSQSIEKMSPTVNNPDNNPDTNQSNHQQSKILLTPILSLLLGIFALVISLFIGIFTSAEGRSDSTAKTLYISFILALMSFFYVSIFLFCLYVPKIFILISSMIQKPSESTFASAIHLESITALFSLTIFCFITSRILAERALLPVFKLFGLEDFRGVLEVDPYAEETGDTYFFDLAVVFFMLTLTKYVISLISINFFQKAYSKRIAKCNRLSRIFRSILYNEYYGDSEDSFEDKKLELGFKLEQDDSLDINNDKEARALGRRLFRKVLVNERDYFIADDIRSIFHDESLEVIDDLGGKKVGRINEKKMKMVVLSYYKDRKYLRKGIGGSTEILFKMEVFAMFLVFLLAVTSVAESIGKRFLGFMFVMSTSLGIGLFIFSGTITKIFENIIFIMFQHPFDYGDYITLNGKEVYVDNISILHTETTSALDHTYSQVPNVAIKASSIVNHSRSLPYMDQRTLTIQRTNLRKVEDFRVMLSNHLEENSDDFSGYCGVDNYDITPNSIKLTFSVEYADTYGDYETVCERRKKLAEIIDMATISSGLEVL